MTSIYLQKNENNWKLIHAVRIYSQNIGMEFGIEKCAMQVMKSGNKTFDWRNVKTILERWEKRKPTNTWAFWRLTSSNKWRWKAKLRKNISEELESYSRQNCQAENLSKEQIPGLYSSLDIRDPLWSGPEKNLSKWTKQQGN